MQFYDSPLISPEQKVYVLLHIPLLPALLPLVLMPLFVSFNWNSLIWSSYRSICTAVNKDPREMQRTEKNRDMTHHSAETGTSRQTSSAVPQKTSLSSLLQEIKWSNGLAAHTYSGNCLFFHCTKELEYTVYPSVLLRNRALLPWDLIQNSKTRRMSQ